MVANVSNIAALLADNKTIPASRPTTALAGFTSWFGGGGEDFDRNLTTDFVDLSRRDDATKATGDHILRKSRVSSLISWVICPLKAVTR